MEKNGLIYISGAMSGLPDFNYPAFHAAAKHLRELGYSVINPAEVTTIAEHKNWSDYMRTDIRFLMECSKVVALAGWECSKGAGIEIRLAADLDMEVWEYDRESTECLKQLNPAFAIRDRHKKI